MEHELVCEICSAMHPPGSYPQGCPDCRTRDQQGRLEVRYSPEVLADAEVPDPDQRPSGIPSMWRYRSVIPVLRDSPITLGEGGTPLVEPTRFGADLDATIVFKNETVNPTWSFKDRLNSLVLSNAQALGETRVTVSSTGNHGASTAAYASRGGIDDVIVLVPDETEAPLRAQIRAYDADVVVTQYEDRDELLSQLVDRGWYPTVNVTDDYTGVPYAAEAYMTIAFELVEQLDTIPDVVIAPIGAGDGLYGIWKGFRELHAADVIAATPRMIGVQPAERASVVAAVETDADTVDARHGPMPITTSVSGPTAGSHSLRAVRESDGTAIAIERPDVERTLAAVARDGLLVEPASALAPAAIDPGFEAGVIDAGDTVVCMATGAGVKWPDLVRGIVGEAPRIPASLSALKDAITTPIGADE